MMMKKYLHVQIRKYIYRVIYQLFLDLSNIFENKFVIFGIFQCCKPIPPNLDVQKYYGQETIYFCNNCKKSQFRLVSRDSRHQKTHPKTETINVMDKLLWSEKYSIRFFKIFQELQTLFKRKKLKLLSIIILLTLYSSFIEIYKTNLWKNPRTMIKAQNFKSKIFLNNLRLFRLDDLLPSNKLSNSV